MRTSAGERQAAVGGASRSNVALSLQQVHVLMEQDRLSEAMRLLYWLIRAKPDLSDAYLLRGQCFLAMGYPEDAGQEYRSALRLGADQRALERPVAAIRHQLKTREDACRAVRCIQDFEVLRFLGTGWEGAVYLCRDSAANRFVVKIFHPHRVDKFNAPVHWYRRPVPAIGEQIIRLGQSLRRTPHPLFFGYEALTANARLTGLYYPYRRLYPLRPHHLLDRGFRATLLRQALSGQGHLLATSGLMMSDLHLGQFMFDGRGQIHYVDYGASLLAVSDHRITEDRLHVLALIRLLADAFAPEQRGEFAGTRARYASAAELQEQVDRSPGLQRCLRAFPGLKCFIGPGAISDPACFMESECYREVSAMIAGRPRVRTLVRVVGGAARRSVREQVEGMARALTTATRSIS